MSIKCLWTANVVTLFPEVFPGTLGVSVIGKALAHDQWRLNIINLRDFADDKFGHVDTPPCGGGGGMVIRPDVISRALSSIDCHNRAKSGKPPIFYLSPRGRLVDQSLIKGIITKSDAIFLCGRYEGIDQRVIDSYNMQEISICDCVLAGGEVAAMAVIESCVRFLPGVLGNQQSAKLDSFSNSLLEHNQYAVLDNWDGRLIPEVLLTGDHGKIDDFRYSESKNITRLNRPDIWGQYVSKSLMPDTE